MNKEEYIKYVETHEVLNRFLETDSTLNTISNILVLKGICTKEEFANIKEQCKKQILEDSYAREKKEDLEAVKTINNFFGGLWT